MLIRTATANDIPDIQRLYQQLEDHHLHLRPDIFQPCNGPGRPDEQIREWIEGQDTDYLIAEINARLAGFLSIKISSASALPMFKPQQFATVNSAVVDLPHRSAGIGSALLEAAKEWAAARNLKTIRVHVWTDNAAAQRFYLARGFQPLTTLLQLDL